MKNNFKQLYNDPEFAKNVGRSLSACVREGVAAQVMIGIFDYYLVPLAIFLKASTTQIGILMSLPHLLSSLSQIFAIHVIQLAGSRKRLLMRSIGIQILFLLPIPFLTLMNIPHRVELLIFYVIVFRVIGSLMGPAWGSIVSDYLPQDMRGQFFGRRAQIISISGLVSMGFWGVLLSLMNKVAEGWGLFIVFLSAAVCRMVSFYFMNKLVELPHVGTHSDTDFTFWMFIRRFRESNFVKFLLYAASITFATQLSSAYFSVYMLNDLKFSYIGYMSVHLSSLFMNLISFPIWGKHADLIGNAKILKLTSFLLPISPLLWIFNSHLYALIPIEMFSGFVWGGFNLCVTNFIYDAVQPAKRVRCLCYFNMINSVALFAGASLGGILATRLPSLGGGKSPLLTLFLISGIVRILAHFILSPHFREVRPAYQKVRSASLCMSVLGVRPIMGMNVEGGIYPKLRRLFRRPAPTASV
jgi:MFS family permease